MYNGTIKVFDDNDNVQFEQAAKVDYEGITRASEQGFKEIGDITVYLKDYPQTEPGRGNYAIATDKRGRVNKCTISEWKPDGSMNGSIILNNFEASWPSALN